MKDKVVIITGATSGIGKALAYAYAGKGSKVVIGARNHENLLEVAEDIKLGGGEVAFAQTDVTSETDCKNLILTAVERFGGVDILINNAGISMRALFDDVDLVVIKQLMDVNFWGTVYCTKHALPYIQKTKGSICGVSSTAGLVGLPGRTGYSASKFAMKGFLDSIRTENLKKGVHVLMAYPGFTASNIRVTSLTKDGTPQGKSPREEGKMMSAEDVASHIYSAIEKRKSSLVLTFEGKAVAILNKFFPSWVNKMVYNKMAKEPDSPFK
jgi:short-subunit dehydrogenase